MDDLPEQALNFYRRHFRLILSGILVLALVLRVAALLSYQKSIYAGFLIWDENVYHNWALKILEGKAQTYGVHDFAPLPAYVMGLLYKFFSPNPSVFRIFNIQLSTLTCYLFYVIGKILANRSVGLIACLFSALYGPFIFFSFTLLKTSLSVFLFALALYLFLLNYKTVSKFRTLGIGITIGLLLNVRPNMILVLFFLPFAMIWNWRRQSLLYKNILPLLILYIIGVGISAGPFVVMKYRVSKEIALTASGGFNLYLANNLQNPYPYYRPVPFAVSIPSKQATHFIIEASRRTGKKLSPKEASSLFTGKVLKSACEQPLLFAEKLSLKFLALFNGFEPADNYHIGFMSNYIRLFKLPFLTFWVMLPLGMVGLAATFKSSGMSRALAWIFFLYGITLVIFFTNIRIRMPLLVILIPMAACGLETLCTSIRNRRLKQAISLALVGFGFAVIAVIPIPGSDDMTGYYNTHAMNLNRKGKTEEAVHFWKRSSQLNKPYSAYANLSLATVCLRKGNTSSAMNYLDKISEESFAVAHKYEMMGDIFTRHKLYERAAEAYEKSLDINSACVNPRRKLIEVYNKQDPKKAAEERRRLSYIASFMPG